MQTIKVTVKRTKKATTFYIDDRNIGGVFAINGSNGWFKEITFPIDSENGRSYSTREFASLDAKEQIKSFFADYLNIEVEFVNLNDE